MNDAGEELLRSKYLAMAARIKELTGELWNGLVFAAHWPAVQVELELRGEQFLAVWRRGDPGLFVHASAKPNGPAGDNWKNTLAWDAAFIVTELVKDGEPLVRTTEQWGDFLNRE